jgi:hypothetical protein
MMRNFIGRRLRLVVGEGLAVWLLLMPPTNLRAQFDTAAVLGTVRDGKGGTIANARISVRNLATGITNQTSTDAEGEYIFPAVKIGTYEVRGEAPGFSAAIAANVNVTVNARQRVDLTLQVGQVTEVVNVVETTPLLETDSSSKGQVIGQRQIVNLPIRGRTYSSLALLAPGVRESQSGNSGDITTRREGSYNVNGLRSVYNNFLLDGVDNNFYGTTNQGYSNQAAQPSPDSVAEFRMSVNAYSAEYGRTGGAVMNVSTRSGSNEYHGTLWDYFQNTSLNAVGFFKPAENRKPQTNRNQFGFVFGGHIIRDRTFFFADYEGSRWIQNPFSLTSIPSLDQRQGILNADVRVPFSFTASDGRTIQAGTVIPAGQPVPMTAFAKRVLAELPAPNRPGGGAFGISNNFGGFSLNRLFEDKGAIKLDHRISDRLSSFARYSHRHQSIVQPGLVTGFSGGNATGLLDTYNQQGIGGLTFSASPTSVIEYRFAVTRLGMDRLPMSIGGPSMRELFGITGLPEGPRIQGGVTPQDITGFTRIGRQSTSPQAQFPRTLNSRFNYNKIRGRHNLKTGHEWLHLAIAVDDTNPLYGIDAYGGGFSRPTPGATNTAYSLADFYFGARSIYQLATQKVADTRQWANWFYVQDDWRVSDKLTLNLGVRYEITTPMYDAKNEAANFDLGTRKLVLAKDGSIEDRALRKMDWNNFAPRIGLAYQVTKNTVIRSGYGLGYNYWNRMASAEVLGTNAPFVTRFSRTNSILNVGNVCSGNAFESCFRPTWEGYPTNLPSNVILYMQRDMPWSYIQNWHFTVQHSITPNTVVDVAYVGNRGVKLPLLGDLNQARPVTAAELTATGTPLATLDARRPVQGFGNITAVVPTGFSNYNALQVRFEHRGGDLTLLNSFTYSKAIDNVGQVLEGTNGGSPNPQDFYNPNNDKGPSSFDQRFNNTTSVVYALPFGHGKRFGSGMPGVVDAVAGGWEASSIINLQSGQPLNLRYGDTDGRLSDGQADFLGNVALRPSIVDPAAGILAASGQRTYDNYFNRANIVIPPATQPFGNIGRNAVYGYALYQVNLMMQKNFALPFINEQSRLTFRAEAFNLFNTTNFTAPTTDLRSANFGRVGSTFDPRAIQLALRLSF